MFEALLIRNRMPVEITGVHFRVETCARLANELGFHIVEPFDDPNVICGQVSSSQLVLYFRLHTSYIVLSNFF